jgi:glycosyltransferase involved in cell wall biosynthesis
VFAAVMPQALYHIWREYQRFRPDVVHAHIFYSFPAGLLLEAMTGRPLVYTVPSRFSHIAEHGFGWLLRLYPRFQRRVDLYLTGFPSELTAVGVPEQKVVGLVAAADMAKILAVKAEAPRHRAEIRRRLDVPADAPLALSVGRLHPSKGHEYALRALPRLLERFPNLHWVALGEGPERDRLTSLAHELGVQRHAHFVGFVEEPLPWYAAADVYLRTMVLEGDNLSSCEAMAIGLPVVGFDTGATETEHVNRAGHGILVPNRDPEALAAAVAEILELPDRGESLGARGTAYCQAHYDTAEFVGNLLTTYADLAARRRRRSRQSGSRATPQSV